MLNADAAERGDESSGGNDWKLIAVHDDGDVDDGNDAVRHVIPTTVSDGDTLDVDEWMLQ